MTECIPTSLQVSLGFSVTLSRIKPLLKTDDLMDDAINLHKSPWSTGCTKQSMINGYHAMCMAST